MIHQTGSRSLSERILDPSNTSICEPLPLLDHAVISWAENTWHTLHKRNASHVGKREIIVLKRCQNWLAFFGSLLNSLEGFFGLGCLVVIRIHPNTSPHLGVSKNSGTPKSSILNNRVFHYKPSILEYPYWIGNTHLVPPFVSPPSDCNFEDLHGHPLAVTREQLRICPSKCWASTA